MEEHVENKNTVCQEQSVRYVWGYFLTFYSSIPVCFTPFPTDVNQWFPHSDRYEPSDDQFHTFHHLFFFFLNFRSITAVLFSAFVSVVYCPALPPPENGFFIQNVCNNHFEAACGVRCLPEFDLQGTSIRLCQADGTWSGTPASCTGEEKGNQKHAVTLLLWPMMPLMPDNVL